MRILNFFYQIYFLNQQVILFIAIGFLCYLIGLGQLILLVEFLNLEVNLANVIASFITIFICYKLNAKFVFKAGRFSKSKEIVAFYLFSSIGFFINIALMFILTKYLLIGYVVSKTVVTLIVAVFNFVSRKKFVFSNVIALTLF